MILKSKKIKFGLLVLVISCCQAIQSNYDLTLALQLAMKLPKQSQTLPGTVPPPAPSASAQGQF